MNELLKNNPLNKDLLTVIAKAPLLAQRAYENLVDPELEDYFLVFCEVKNTEVLQSAWEKIKESKDMEFINKVYNYCSNMLIRPFITAPNEHNVLMQDIKIEAAKILQKSKAELIVEKIISATMESNRFDKH